MVRLTTASKSPISIHALRGEGDKMLRKASKNMDISIHALRGEGDAPQEVLVQKLDGFQSTPSVGRATV